MRIKLLTLLLLASIGLPVYSQGGSDGTYYGIKPRTKKFKASYELYKKTKKEIPQDEYKQYRRARLKGKTQDSLSAEQHKKIRKAALSNKMQRKISPEAYRKIKAQRNNPKSIRKVSSNFYRSVKKSKVKGLSVKKRKMSYSDYKKFRNILYKNDIKFKTF